MKPVTGPKKTPSAVFSLTGGNVEELNSLQERARSRMYEDLAARRRDGWRPEMTDAELLSIAQMSGQITRELVADAALAAHDRVVKRVNTGPHVVVEEAAPRSYRIDPRREPDSK